MSRPQRKARKTPSAQAPVVVATPTEWRRGLAVAALLTVVAVVVYWPALRAGFVWDDDTILTQNRLVRATDGLYRMWFTTEAFDYWPVTNSSFWLEWRLWGLQATGYHVVNLLLHVANALLFWRILRRLAIPGALLAALIFLVHPVNVESVAWITQLKNTLSMCFLLASALWFVTDDDEAERSGERANGLWYWLSLAAFVLAMLSKASVVVVPVMLLLIIWWRQDRVSVRDLVRVAPFFAVAGALTLVNMWFRGHGTGNVIRPSGMLERLLGAGAAVWFYLYKALVPINLTFIYPQWKIDPGSFSWWAPLLLLMATGAVLVSQRRRPWGRAVLFAAAFFVAGLLPALGFVDVYFMKYSLVADHYQYIAMLGLIALVAAALSKIPLAARALDLGVTGLCLAVGLPLGVLAWRQTHQFSDAETLYRTTIERNPSAWMAYNNLGILRLKQSNGDVREAVPLFQTAIAINPDDAASHENLGTAWERQGRLTEAVAEHMEAIRLDPTLAAPHTNLSVVLSRLGRKEDALKESMEAVRLEPNFSDGHNNLGTALENLGRLDEALSEYRRAVQLQPDSAEMHNNLGNAMRSLNRSEEATQEHLKALQLQPDYADAHNAYGEDLQAAGKLTDAAGQYADAIRLQADNASAHRNLALLLDEAGRLDDALPHYRAVVRIAPRTAAAQDELGDALRRSGHPDEAVQHFQQAITIEPAYGPAHFHLGYLLQNAGRLDAAVGEYEAALRYDASAEVNNNLGVLLLKLGRRQEAIARFREALRLQPNDVVTQQNLARALAGGH